MVPGAGLEPARSYLREILSLLRLPISPSGQCSWCILHLTQKWRLESESNRRTRSCSPLHNHSAIQPKESMERGKRFDRADDSALDPTCFATLSKLEREKRFELSTLALARRCSTTELFPLDSRANYTHRCELVNQQCLKHHAQVINCLHGAAKVWPGSFEILNH